jgi:hypothetical protein
MAERVENKKNKIYQIYEILAAAASWLDDPENEEKSRAFEDMKSSLIIREYIPIAQKEICLKKTLLDIKGDINSTPYSIAIEYEINLLFDCLLAYVVNLESDINTLYKDASFYDLLVTSGLKDHILFFCEKDYTEIRQMADKMIAFENLRDLADTFDMASPESVKEMTRAFKNFTSDSNQEMIKRLGDIMANNDPILNNIKTSVEEGAYKTIKAAKEKEAELEEKEE